jgi:hypothetical protein
MSTTPDTAPSLIELEIRAGIATLTLNRPEKRNAITDGMRSDFVVALEKVAADNAVRALVLTGAGKGFCAGGDVAGMQRRMDAPAGEVGFNGWSRQQGVHHSVSLLHTMPKPVVAAVNGGANGLGADMAMALDHGQDHGQFLDLAAVGNGQHQVDRLDHPEVAVARLGRVHEHRRRAGGGEGGGDLAADVAALAHAHHDHAAAHFEDLAHGVHEAGTDTVLQAEDGFGFDVEGQACPSEDGFGVDHWGRGGAGAHCRILRATQCRETACPGQARGTDIALASAPMSSFDLTLLYLLAAVIGVVVCRSLKLPPMLGYLSAGVLIGPHALALTGSTETEGIRHLGEFGVVFLMFVIGLEFSLPKLRAMRKHVFGLGLLQVLLTMAIATAGALIIATQLPPAWRLGWQTALALSGALTMSSTAIVVKLMAERLELESEHGKRVMGVLLFQDLAVVPLLVLIPALGAPPEALAKALGLALVKATVLIGLLLYGGPPDFGDRIQAPGGSRHPPVPRRAAGPVLHHHRHAARLAPGGPALGGGAGFGDPARAVQAAAGDRARQAVRCQHGRLAAHRALSRAGGRVRLRAAGAGAADGAGAAGAAQPDPRQHGDLDAGHALHHPVEQRHRDEAGRQRVAAAVAADDDHRAQDDQRQQARDHLRLRPLRAEPGALLEQENIPYMALDLDPDRVRQAAAAGDSVVFGDAARLQALIAAGLARASAVVVTYLDVPGALKVLANARSHAPQVPVIVRTQDDTTSRSCARPAPPRSCRKRWKAR